jgi:hypothetical protein
MKLRFTLYDESETLQIKPPDGWKKMKIIFDRHPELYSVRVRIDTPLDFWGTNEAAGTNGGRDFLLRKRRELGPDGVVGLLTEWSIDDGFTWKTLCDQEVPLSDTYSESVGIDHRAQATLKEKGLWTKLMNGFEKPVDINSATALDGTAVTVYDPIDLRLPTQIINKTTRYTGHSGDIDSLDNVALATTANITLSGHQTIDGILTTEGMRVLVKDQTLGENNGVYTASSGAWTRAADANTAVELQLAIVSVVGGTVNGGKHYRVAEDTIVLGTTPITFTEYNYVDHFILATNNTHEDEDIEWVFYTPDTADMLLSEIVNSYTRAVLGESLLTDIESTIEPASDRGILQMNGSIDLSYHFDTTISGSTSANRRTVVSWYFQKNDEAPVLLDQFDTGYDPIPISYPLFFTLNASHNETILPGDIIKTWLSWSTQQSPGTGTYLTRAVIGGIVNQDISFTLLSEFPETQTKAELIHDLFSKTCDRVLGADDTFYSPDLGSPYNTTKQYEEEGPDWAYALSKFLQVRGYTLTEKPFFTTMRDLWQGWNPIGNYGMGTVTVDDEQKILVARKKYFFPDDRVSIRLSGVWKMRQFDDGNLQFSSIEDGYEKSEIEDVGGIDDVHGTRITNSVFTRIGQKFVNKSRFIASLIWEQARRTLRTQSSDYKYDDDIGIVNVRRVDGQPYVPVLDENFSSVTNLQNEATRYNKVITPRRNFLRWLDFYSIGLQDYLSSFFNFGSGTGNYDMSAIMADNGEPESFGGAALSEKQNIPVSDSPLFTAEVYEIQEHFITSAQLAAMIADPDAAIEVSQTDTDYVKFYTKLIEVIPATGELSGTAWAKEHMDLKVVPKTQRIFGGEFGDEFG